jgi:hypothetical protein
MARKRKDGNPCSGHVINLCEENRIAVMHLKAEIERKHQSSIDEVVNRIISEWAFTHIDPVMPSEQILLK